MKTVLKKIDTTTGQCVEFIVVEGISGTSIKGYKFSHSFLDKSVYRFNKCDDSDVVYVYTRKNSKYQWYQIYDWGFVCVSEEAPAEEAPAEEAPAEFTVRYYTGCSWCSVVTMSSIGLTGKSTKYNMLSNALEKAYELTKKGYAVRIYTGRKKVCELSRYAMTHCGIIVEKPLFSSEFKYLDSVSLAPNLGYFYNPRDQS